MVYANKTAFMCFKQEGTISTFSSRTQKFVNQFTYLDSNIASTENDVNIRHLKVWTATDKLSTIWKYDNIYQPLRSGWIWHKIDF